MVSPLLLLLVLHFLTNYGDGRNLCSFIHLPERESLHKGGGTPWGIASSTSEDPFPANVTQ
ncbi:hypothetical protein Lal_00042073 [Lupinus albus]|nr:hypothetical protein Lal_00042073 [Lupinus albus]